MLRVSEASSKVVGDNAGAGFVFCKTVACELLPANNTKRDLEKLSEKVVLGTSKLEVPFI